MKRIRTLIVMVILGVGSMVFGEDKILFDGKQPAWDGTEIKADPENTDNKVMLWVRDTIDTSPSDKDWSKYIALSFKMYSAEADGYGIIIGCDSNPEGTSGNYYLKKITVDWKGWKTITIPFAEFAVFRSSDVVGWKWIPRLTMFTKGWGVEQRNPKAEYYIDDVKLVETEKK